MAFSPPVLGYLVKKGLQKGESRAPQDPPGHALEIPLVLCPICDNGATRKVDQASKVDKASKVRQASKVS